MARAAPAAPAPTRETVAPPPTVAATSVCAPASLELAFGAEADSGYLVVSAVVVVMLDSGAPVVVVASASAFSILALLALYRALTNLLATGCAAFGTVALTTFNAALRHFFSWCVVLQASGYAGAPWRLLKKCFHGFMLVSLPTGMPKLLR